jgi:putative tricarboxylic transport membrane protein
MRLLAAVVMVMAARVVWASSSGSVFDLWLLLGFSLAGWALLNAGLEPTPLLIGFVLAGPFEEALRRALVLASGDWRVFVVEPASVALLIAALLVTALSALRRAHRS